MKLNSSKRTLPDLISEAIVQFILKEHLKPGDKLPTEKELSQQLGIGRTSLREGIRQLDTLGLLSIHQGKGIYLKEITLDSLFTSRKHIPIASFLRLDKQEILDLLSVRLLLELEACRLAAERITDEEIAVLREIHQGMAASLSNREEFIALAVKFHKQIVFSSGNVILSNVFEFIEDLYSKQVSIITNFPEAMDHSLSFHGKILVALVGNNVELAVKSLQAHIEDVREAVMAHFDTMQNT